MSDLMNKTICLKMNANWFPIGWTTIRDAIIDLTGGRDGKPPSLAIDIEYVQLENGEWDYDHPVYMNPVKWEDWILLKVRECDAAVHSAHRVIRAPTVLIASNYRDIPKRMLKATKEAIRRRDGNQCQYSGKILARKDLDIDHIIPQSLGGKSTFSNMVVCDRNVNRMKGNRRNHEIGLKLIKTPIEPMPIPVSVHVNEIKHPSWKLFLLNPKLPSNTED
jgi:5-methylcytosine-specific restriction endonuclease McrA